MQSMKTDIETLRHGSYGAGAGRSTQVFAKLCPGTEALYWAKSLVAVNPEGPKSFQKLPVHCLPFHLASKIPFNTLLSCQALIWLCNYAQKVDPQIMEQFVDHAPAEV